MAWAVALPIIFEIYRDFGYSPVITSGMDGKHRKDSLHYTGHALDLRTRHVHPNERMALTAALAAALGDEFDVILEETHVHIEFDSPYPAPPGAHGL